MAYAKVFKSEDNDSQEEIVTKTAKKKVKKD